MYCCDSSDTSIGNDLKIDVFMAENDLKIDVNIAAIGPPGKSPYIGEYGTWMVWQNGEWVDTGVIAGGSGEMYKIGAGLKVTNGTLSVDSVNDAEQDNTKPITSAGVYKVVGNIEVLLSTI